MAKEKLSEKLALTYFILPKKNSAKYHRLYKKMLNTYMAQISELAQLPTKTALILYWNTIAAFWTAMQQIHYHMHETTMTLSV